MGKVYCKDCVYLDLKLPLSWVDKFDLLGMNYTHKSNKCVEVIRDGDFFNKEKEGLVYNKKAYILNENNDCGNFIKINPFIRMINNLF